jgi:hypothetical protein
MKRKSLISRYNKLSIWNKVAIWGAIASIVGLILMIQSKNSSQRVTVVDSRNLAILQPGNDIHIHYYEQKFFDENNKELLNFKDLIVLSQKILSGKMGYMRIKVNKILINTSDERFVTLKYKSGEYEPVTLTFKNDRKWGPGIIFTSPEYERRTEIYLFQCFRFNVGGKMIFTEDFIFNLYYNDICLYLVTQTGEIRWEYPPHYSGYRMPSVKFGENTCLGYFDPNAKEKNIRASERLVALKKLLGTN